MTTKDFTVDQLKNMLLGDSTELEEVEDTLTGYGRWERYHQVVFKELATNQCYAAKYAMGATEEQENSFFEWQAVSKGGQLVNECPEVHPVLVITTQWEEV